MVRSGGLLAMSSLLLLTSCARPPVEPAPAAAMRVQATPIPTTAPSPPPTPVPVPVAPVPVPVRVAAPKPKPAKPQSPPPPVASIDSFRGLGGWLDVFDFNDDPASVLPAVRDMAARGVRTLYLETARFNSPQAFLFPRSNAAALEEAHRLGIKVVAWYPPDFQNLDRDVAYTLAAVNYTSPNGHRFDAVAPDIERMDVKDQNERTARLLEYSRRIREGSPPGYPLGAIVIAWSSPYYRSAWSTFPWGELKHYYGAVLPMAYWTGRKADPETARAITEENVRESGRLSGLPVHVIGGVADKIDTAQAVAYVEAALGGGSIGGGLYDYRTQAPRPELWEPLARLNR